MPFLIHRSALYRMLFMSVLLILFASAVPVARAAPAGPTRVATSTVLPCSDLAEPNCGPDAATLTWHGGAVLHHPKIYLIFWGPNWSWSDPIVVHLQQLFNTLSGGDYNNILSQYSDPNGPVVNDGVALLDTYLDKRVPDPLNVGYTLDTQSAPHPSIEQEAQDALAAAHTDISTNTSTAAWQDTPDTLFLVVPQYGTQDAQVAGRCGAHSWAGGQSYFYYAFVDVTTSQCNIAPPPPSTIPQDWQDADATATHEYAETATDAQIIAGSYLSSGWMTNAGQEIGDLCSGTTHQTYNEDLLLPSGADTPVVQMLWDKNAGGCNSAVGQEYPAPPGLGKHTVMGAILTHYGTTNSAGQLILSIIGPPVSEELPVGSGRVSYFAGNGCGSFTGPSSSHSAIYWSKPTQAWQVGGCIYVHYLTPGGDLAGQGGPTSSLGFSTSDVTAISGGYVSYFAGNKCGSGGPSNSGSAIYYSSGNAYFVSGCIYSVYQTNKAFQGYIGFPVSDENHYASYGLYASYFAGNKCGSTPHPDNSGTAIYTDSYGTFVESGCIYDSYVGNGEYTGLLGIPTSDTTQISGGWLAQFNGTNCTSGGWQGSGSAIYNNASGTFEVQGCIYQKYLYWGGSAGKLGFPLSSEQPINGSNGTSGRVNYFQGGNCGNPGPNNSNSGIYWSAATQAGYEVQGCIFAFYRSIGGPASALGFPISDEYVNTAGQPESDFVGGSIVWNGSQAILTLGH